mgnify:CR=1 FL=1
MHVDNEVMSVRLEVETAFKKRDWGTILEHENAIRSSSDPGELRALAEAYLYTAAYSDAVKMFRQVKPLLTGRALAACLINGGTALFRVGDLHDSSRWLEEYFGQDVRPFDGAAYELQAHILWKMGAPAADVKECFQKAIGIFSADAERVERLRVDLAEYLVELGELESARANLEAVTLPCLRGYVMGVRARISKVTGDQGLAFTQAMAAVRLLYTTVDRFGSVLEEIARLYLLLASMVPTRDRGGFLSAALVAAQTIQSPPLYSYIQELRKEVQKCGES